MKLQKKSLDIRQKQKNIRDLSGIKAAASSCKSTLFSRGRRSEAFFTEDSKLYITPREYSLLRQGVKLDRGTHKWDSLSSRIERNFQYYQPSRASILLEALEKRKQLLGESVSEASRNFVGQFTLVRLWNMSIVGAILFGMVTMTFVYKYLGQGASAQLRTDVTEQQAEQQIAAIPQVLGVETSSNDKQSTQNVSTASKDTDRKQLEKDIRAMLKDYPMEKMAPYIAKYDRTVAAYIVGIAKQESGWGEHHPVLNGQDCYNYWGYRGQRKLMGTGGHTCFNSPQDAVDTVAKRIQYLVETEGLTTAKQLVIWKCGTECAADKNASNWIQNVNAYSQELSDK
ncbi:MAG TPA: hypothetical protein VF817_04035 [Patescibacteria group bacterium]